MRIGLLLLAVIIISYSCSEISGKETPRQQKTNSPAEGNAGLPPDELRVGRTEAGQMRARRGNDNASFKISARDLRSLMAGSNAETDSFVFYLVRYSANSSTDRARYLRKVPNANWNDVLRKPSSILVGFLSGTVATKNLTRDLYQREVAVYDLGVVCPPPPNCGCEIAQ